MQPAVTAETKVIAPAVICAMAAGSSDIIYIWNKMTTSYTVESRDYRFPFMPYWQPVFSKKPVFSRISEHITNITYNDTDIPPELYSRNSTNIQF